MPYKDYHILTNVRSGGTSHVYQVIDRDTDELRVMKVTSFKHIQKSIWLNEIHMLQKFQYVRGVVKMYEFGEVEDTNQETFGYAVLEWCDEDLLKSPVDAPEWTRIFGFLCHVLSTLHTLGYCYCDLKPENILLKGQGYRLCDFSTCQPSGTLTSVLYGTPHVLAPELLQQLEEAQDHRYDEKIDSWGLGCLMVELILQEQFDRDRRLEQLSRIQDEYFRSLLPLLLDPDPRTRLTIGELMRRLQGLPSTEPAVRAEDIKPYLPPLATPGAGSEASPAPSKPPAELVGSVIKVAAKPADRSRLRAFHPPFVVIRRRLLQKTSTVDDPSSSSSSPPLPTPDQPSPPSVTPSEAAGPGSAPPGLPKNGRRGARGRTLARRHRG